MSKNQCVNCTETIAESETECQYCGFPQRGTKAEKISYNAKLLRLEDLIEDSDKSVKGILSFGIIFGFIAIIILAFSLIFKENHFANVLIFIVIGLIYFILNRVGKKSSYLMVVLALFFHLGHTILEFSYGLFPKGPVDKSLLESSGASLFFEVIPLAYMIFRLALMIVFAKFLWIQLKLKKNEKMVKFIKSKKQDVANFRDTD